LLRSTTTQPTTCSPQPTTTGLPAQLAASSLALQPTQTPLAPSSAAGAIPGSPTSSVQPTAEVSLTAPLPDSARPATRLSHLQTHRWRRLTLTPGATISPKRLPAHPPSAPSLDTRRSVRRTPLLTIRPQKPPPGQAPPSPYLGHTDDLRGRGIPIPPRQYAEAVIREHAARLAADLLDVDEASRVGVEVMTATETLTPDRTPHSRSWNLDVEVMAASESLTPDLTPRSHSWNLDSP